MPLSAAKIRRSKRQNEKSFVVCYRHYIKFSGKNKHAREETDKADGNRSRRVNRQSYRKQIPKSEPTKLPETDPEE